MSEADHAEIHRLSKALPIGSTLETVELSLTSSGRSRVPTADIEVSGTGLDLETTPTLPDDTDHFLEIVFCGGRTLALSPHPIPELATDVRHLSGRTVARGINHITLTDTGHKPLLANSMLQCGGARRSALCKNAGQDRLRAISRASRPFRRCATSTGKRKGWPIGGLQPYFRSRFEKSTRRSRFHAARWRPGSYCRQ